jgi:hypothetical protein
MAGSGIAAPPNMPAANNADTKTFFVNIFYSPVEPSKPITTAWRPDGGGRIS